MWRLAPEARKSLSKPRKRGGKGEAGAVSQLVKDKSLSFLNERLIAEPGGQDEGWAATSQFRESWRKKDRSLARDLFGLQKFIPVQPECYRRSITPKLRAPIFS